MAVLSNPLAKIGDVIRGSLIAENLSQIRPLCQSITDYVTKGKGKFYIKNFWADPKPLSLGYVGVHIKIRMPIRSQEAKVERDAPPNKKYILMEVQLHLKAIMDGTEGCAKEIAHRLYKTPTQDGEEAISPELISSSQLIYLTSMKRLLSKKEDLESVERTVHLVQNATKAEHKKRQILDTALLLLQDRELAKKLGNVDWSDRLQVFVPQDKEAISLAWMETAREINEIIQLPCVNMDEREEWTNTATSEEEIYADAKEMSLFFDSMCRIAARSQPGCTVNYGPNNACMIKTKKSLQEKMEADHEEELGRLINHLLQKIGKTWAQITESNAVPFRKFSQLQNLNFSGCSQMTDSDLKLLKSFRALQTLSLADCNQITDSGLANLELLTNLQNLNLSGCSQITDNALRHFWRLTKLETYHFDGCQITDAARIRWVQSRNLSPQQGPRPVIIQPKLQQPPAAIVNPQNAKNYDLMQEFLVATLRGLGYGICASTINKLTISANDLILTTCGVEGDQVRYSFLATALFPAFIFSIAGMNNETTTWLQRESLPINMARCGVIALGSSAAWLGALEFGVARLGKMTLRTFMSWLAGVEFQKTLLEDSTEMLEVVKQPRGWALGGMLFTAFMITGAVMNIFDRFGEINSSISNRNLTISIPVGMCLATVTVAMLNNDFASTIAIIPVVSGIFTCMTTMMRHYFTSDRQS